MATDKEILDWLDANMKGYGNGWICRDSTMGRGLRLHETRGDLVRDGGYPQLTAREAIMDAMGRGV